MEQPKYDTGFDTEKVSIFPGMLYLDQAISTPGINDILHSWFTDELQQRPELWKRRNQIRPITLIDIDTIILYHNDFISGRIDLEQFIEGFWNWKVQHKITGVKTENNELLNKSLIGFGNFLRDHVKIEAIPDIILALGESLFREDESPK